MGLGWWRNAFATYRRRRCKRIVPPHLGLSCGDHERQNQSVYGDEKHFLHPIDLLLKLPD
jgi:hypothetical protein